MTCRASQRQSEGSSRSNPFIDFNKHMVHAMLTDSSRNYTVVAQYLHTSSFYQILHLLSKFSIYSSLS